MADDVTFQDANLSTPPDATIIATDEASGSRHVQLVKLAQPTGGSATAWGDATDGLPVEITNTTVAISGSISATTSADIERIQVTPTITAATPYIVKEAVGGLMTFANAAAASGGSGVVRSVVVVDKDAERADLDLVLFSATVSGVIDSSAFDPTDADLANFVGFVPIGSGFFSDFTDNAASFIATDLPYKLAGTDLFGVLVARSTPTYTATTDLVVTLTVERF